MKTPLKFMIALTALIYITSINVNAQSNIAEKTSITNNKVNCCKANKQEQISYEEFINHYGIDDTSLAIIDIYFDKRENSAAGRMTMIPVAAAITLINAPIGVGLMAISTPIALSGVYTRIKYNRTHLVKTLVNYQNENILTANLKHKVLAYLTVKEELKQEELTNSPQLATITRK